MTGTPDVVVAYVGGVGRSGTTLLDRLIGQIESAVSVGELVHLWFRGVLEDQRCGCGKRFHSCPFWIEVGQVAYGGWSPAHARAVIDLKAKVDRTRKIFRIARPRGEFATDLVALRDQLSPLYRALRAVSGASVVIDSSKHASYGFVLGGAPGVDLRVIHVVRGIEGVTHSWRKVVARPETDGAEEMPRYSPARVGVRWVAQNLLFEQLARQRPGVLVRYEDAVERPRELLTRVAALLDLPERDFPFLTGSRVELSTDHTVAGNPMRFTTGSIDLRPDDAWRRGLAPAPKLLARGIVAPVAGRYGYSWRGEHAVGAPVSRAS